MAMNLLPLGSLGAVENKSDGTVTFGIWLPWVSDSDGNSVHVKIIHERDQFLQNIPPQEFPLTHSVRRSLWRFLVGDGADCRNPAGNTRLRLG